MTIHVTLGDCDDAGRASRRPRGSGTICALGVIAGIALLGAALSARAEVPKTPAIEGPITGPGEMHPGMRFGPEGTNPDDFDYVAEEYFASGTAGPTNAPYKVRVLVRRPGKRTPEMNRGIQRHIVVY